MEQALADIKTRIPDFAGYGDETTRRLADEQIRAIVGEAVALLHDRHAEFFSAGDMAEQYDAMIMRCGFTNQAVFKEFEYEALGDDQRVRIAHADEALIAKAEQAQDVTADSLAAYLADLQ
ncbi:MAG: hypothetical protein M3N19_02300, partial [Candidatus Eremiobacteraeota bacterium]|nr:hypothetical protein [Candidatus Eremiobacteraeota bacterium]